MPKMFFDKENLKLLQWFSPKKSTLEHPGTSHIFWCLLDHQKFLHRCVHHFKESVLHSYLSTFSTPFCSLAPADSHSKICSIFSSLVKNHDPSGVSNLSPYYQYSCQQHHLLLLLPPFKKNSLHQEKNSNEMPDRFCCLMFEFPQCYSKICFVQNKKHFYV